jgi:hypothetical protein
MTKANFDAIYTAPDPRQYYRTLGSYDYQIPTHGATVFGQLARGFGDEPSPRIVDLCCSYGVNATVLNHDLDFEEVIAHYCDPSSDDLDRDELLALDQEWYSSHRRDEALRICGVDSAEPAISYALEAGLIDVGYAEDLETCESSPGLVEELQEADLITVSGGIGYISERTIDRVLTHTRTPRLAALCLRWIDFAPIVEVAAAHGLVTERLDEATFPQRRFADDDEGRHVRAELDRLGVDPEGREAMGYHHTDLYILRPKDEALALPLDTVLTPTGAIDETGTEITDSDDLDVSLFTGSDNHV